MTAWGFVMFVVGGLLWRLLSALEIADRDTTAWVWCAFVIFVIGAVLLLAGISQFLWMKMP